MQRIVEAFRRSGAESLNPASPGHGTRRDVASRMASSVGTVALIDTAEELGPSTSQFNVVEVAGATMTQLAVQNWR